MPAAAQRGLQYTGTGQHYGDMLSGLLNSVTASLPD